MTDAEYATSIIKAEIEAVTQLIDRVDSDFLDAVKMCRQCPGNIIVSGTGKSGFIAQKMAATYASVGIKSFWIHPNDADHGDVGRITDKDVCILFSYSGETKEIINFAKQIKTRYAKIIAVTSKLESTLGELADLRIHIGEFKEAGLVNAIPTSSTTASLVMADALALATVGTSLTKEDFQKNHLGGSIGLRLSKVTQLMRCVDAGNCVVVSVDRPLLDVMLSMTGAHTGAAIVVNKSGYISGIITDGDLRRFITCDNDIRQSVAMDCMKEYPITIDYNKTVEEAIDIFKNCSIGDIPVTDAQLKPIGMLSLKDLTKLTI